MPTTGLGNAGDRQKNSSIVYGVGGRKFVQKEQIRVRQ